MLKKNRRKKVKMIIKTIKREPLSMLQREVFFLSNHSIFMLCLLPPYPVVTGDGYIFCAVWMSHSEIVFRVVDRKLPSNLNKIK